MSVLITGSTGYIGSLLTKKLADQGQSVRLLCRTRPELPEFNRSNIEIVLGDINDPVSLNKAMQGVRQVYHLAAYARLWAKDPSTFRKINVEGTRQVLEAAQKAGVEKLVYTSTAGVIGPSASVPMNEEMPRITGFFNLYESTKAEAEKIALEYADSGLPVSIVNPSRVYGPGLDTGSNPVTKVVERYMKGNWKVIPGTGNDIGSYCYIDDIVDGHLQAMAQGRSGERYIFGGVNASFNQLMEIIMQETGITQKMKHIPFPVLVVFSKLQELKASLTGRPPLITADWARKYKYDWALDSRKAMQDLGYRIRPLEAGIRDTVAWLKNHRNS